MRKAFDTFLLSEVSAELAAKNCGNEPYRYECAHCGEEVRLAAVSSASMVTHFRHRSGNNDIECEKYIGQYGTISTDSHSRKSKTERAEFYFDNSTKMFYLGLRFSDAEIFEYEKLATTFEFRTSSQEQAFYSMQINRRNFMPDVSTMIPIQKFAYKYFLSNTLNGIKRKYEVFKNYSSNTPTFFKIQGTDCSFKAKLVRSSKLYTNVKYLVVLHNQYFYPSDKHFPNEIEVEETFTYETMGRKFLAKALIIKAKTPIIDSLLETWGYQVEASETLTLLWPPATIKDDVFLISSDNAFLYSSFALHPHGNINTYSNSIYRIADRISLLTVNERINIYNKNAEIAIDKMQRDTVSFDNIEVEDIQTNAFTVSDDHRYYLFNNSGVVPLNKGQSVFLSSNSIIRRYINGYLNGLIHLQRQKTLNAEQLIDDIIAYYKRTETFSWDVFDSLELSQAAMQYFESCKELGLVNSAVMNFIKEGRI